MEGFIGTATADAIHMESANTDSTASSGTRDLFFSLLLPLLVELLLLLDPKKLGMLTGRVGNLISGAATSDDLSTPLNITSCGTCCFA